MPGTTPPDKIAATKGYGAEVIFSGPQFEDREVVAAKVINDTGARLVPPHDHPDIILGQATAGLEFQQQVKMPTSLLSALGIIGWLITVSPMICLLDLGHRRA
ncbi:hypothetical protein CDV36_013604 [Fusarium kuroshium]|uniref:Tryptophan synthase beta chain-like PALP domain-containing protein n=1 Tax=Fusarium kuroshium TaxID=2010991 RepID=A0A3M2RN94_9HYPO|nr:hypothetical protein CDV36_013604 [Fusarium kuroshium]